MLVFWGGWGGGGGEIIHANKGIYTPPWYKRLQ